MLDLLLGLGDLSRAALVKLLRALWWLGWDFCVRTVGWSIGWASLRALTLGRFPRQEIKQLDNAPWLQGVLVEVLGLALLAMGIFALSQAWPRL
jgi:hypothetical protein